MAQWQNLLDDGNNSFHKRKWQEAEYCYKEAAFHLDVLWSADVCNVALLKAWICALHNLATLFEVQEDHELALQYLLIPHNRMLSICHSNERCEESQLIAHNALKITFMPIFMFAKRHPMCDSCQHTLSEFKAQLDQNQEIIH